MDRKEELVKSLGALEEKERPLLLALVDEVIFMENQLTELKKLPFIRVNPNNQEQQKTTPAAKQYKELLQQYTNVVKVLFAESGQKEKDEESPLRKWVKSRKTKE